MNMAAIETHSGCGLTLSPDAIGTLLRDKCVEVPISASLWRPHILAAVEGLKRISDDPGLRELFPWHTHREDAYSTRYEQEAGLDHNQKDGENKDVFQYIRGGAWKLGVMGLTPDIIPPQTCLDFLRAMGHIEHLVREVGLVVALAIDNAFGSDRPYAGSIYERILHGTIVIRGLRYRSGKSGTFDANPHIDRGLISIHIYATHEGLWIILPDGRPIRIMECSYEMLCVFFGRKYIAATHDLANGAPHGVKYVRGPEDEDRVSFVGFLHPEAIDADVKFLLEHDLQIKAFERSLRL